MFVVFGEDLRSKGNKIHNIILLHILLYVYVLFILHITCYVMIISF